jgi:hypothetical protein
MYEKEEHSTEYWAERCRLNDCYKFVKPEEIARFRDEYAEIFRSIKDAKGNRIYSEKKVHFEAYEYLDDEDLAALIHQGQTPQGLADIMTM